MFWLVRPLNWMKNRFLQLHPVGGTKSKTEQAPRDSQATLNHSEHLYNPTKREKKSSPPSLDTWPIKYVSLAKSIQFPTASSFNMHKRMSAVALRCFRGIKTAQLCDDSLLLCLNGFFFLGGSTNVMFPGAESRSYDLSARIKTKALHQLPPTSPPEWLWAQGS